MFSTGTQDLMESASVRRRAMTFPPPLFEPAHGIFMKLFRKGAGVVSNGPAWWFTVCRLVPVMESWVVSLGRLGHGHKHAPRHETYKVSRATLHTLTGRQVWAAPSWHWHDVLMSETLSFIGERSAKVGTNGRVQHHGQIHGSFWWMNATFRHYT